MTATDKSNLIQYINYLQARGAESRRKSRQSDIQYIQGWLSGVAETRKQIAEDLMKFIEFMETEV